MRSAILMPNWLGDCLLALSVALRKSAQSEEDVSLIVPGVVVPLLESLCRLPVRAYRRTSRAEFAQTVSETRRGGFGKLYLLPHSFSSAWFGFRTGIAQRRGVCSQWRGPLLTQRLASTVAGRSRHLMAEYSSVLEVDNSSPESWPGLSIEADPEYAGSVAFCPGAIYGPAKRWPGFPDLVDLFAGERIIVLGTEAEREEALRVVRRAPGRVADLAGKTSLVQAARIVAAASVVVSNDSGLMHLAGLLGTPVVGIFCSTTPVWTRPLGAGVRTAAATCPCSPCFARTCRYGHYLCHKEISSRKVFHVAQQVRRADGDGSGG